VLQFERYLGVFDSGVGLIWSGAFTALYYKFSGGSLTVSVLCPTTRSDRGSTAGLHFTPQLLSQLQERGIGSVFVTLHWVGTFRPVQVEDVTTHKMHGEWVEVSAETVEQFTKPGRSGRIIAVGTTVVRALEAAAESGQLQPFAARRTCLSIQVTSGVWWKD